MSDKINSHTILKEQLFKPIVTILLQFLFSICLGQTDTVKTKFTEIRDIVWSENKVYGIDNDGRLLKWNLDTELIENLIYDTAIKFSSIAKDRKSNIVLGTNNGRLFVLPKNKSNLTLLQKLEREIEIRQIVINSNDEMFLVVPNVIYDPARGRYWEKFLHSNRQLIVEKRFLFFFKRRINKYFRMPQNTFLDKSDVIWMTSNYGEFGGSIQRFDSKNRKEINTTIDSLRLSMFFPQSIFSDIESNVYISSGLQHFSNFGEIWKINNDVAERIFDSNDFKKEYPNELFVGPCLIDGITNNIYITTSEGVFKTKMPQSGKIKNIDLLFKPEIFWDREPLAIGAKMSIKKLLVTNEGKLIFLTSKNGVGIYYDGKVKYLTRKTAM